MNVIKLFFIFTLLTINFIPLSFAEEGHDHSSHGKVHKEDNHKNHAGHNDHEEDHGDEHEEGVIKLDQESREMINLQTDKVKTRSLGDRLKVYGQIARDTDNYSHITFKENGVVERIAVKLGDIVDTGDNLLSIRQSDGTVQSITSPSHGTVISIYVKPGDKVDRLKSLMSLVNMDLLRSTIDIYEKDLRFIRVGQKVELMSIAYPEKIFYGKVVFISPEIDDESKSIKVRVDVENHEHLLKLGMSLSGNVIYHSDQDVLVVPKDAVQTVNDEQIVFVLGEHDEIEAREVHVGHAFDKVIEIKSGLKKGDAIVTHGSFYLKSELEKESFAGDGHAH